jgi:hypothetical protein
MEQRGIRMRTRLRVGELRVAGQAARSQQAAALRVAQVDRIKARIMVKQAATAAG